MTYSSSPFAGAPRFSGLAGLALLLTQALAPSTAADKFDCYEGCGNQLEGSVCVENAATGDWHTTCTGLAACPDAGSDVTVLSIHGGRIERHTSDISEDLAGLYGWNRYDFAADLTTAACEALATDGNANNNNFEVLHITASNFNHAEALALVGAHPHAVAIHGCGSSCSDETICIGGRNLQQIADFQDYVNLYRGLLPYDLNPSTVPASGQVSCSSGIGGTSTQNIVNRTSTGQGLQLEMSLDVRTALASDVIQDDLLRGVVYGAVAVAMGELPPPLATFDRTETYAFDGKTYNRFFLRIENRLEYPGDLFAPAPDLPPCGANANSSRTWVRLYDAADDSYLYGFCALGSPSHLSGLWFAREDGTEPAAVFVVLHDRLTGRDYRSNRVLIP